MVGRSVGRSVCLQKNFEKTLGTLISITVREVLMSMSKNAFVRLPKT